MCGSTAREVEMQLREKLKLEKSASYKIGVSLGANQYSEALKLIKCIAAELSTTLYFCALSEEGAGPVRKKDHIHCHRRFVRCHFFPAVEFG